MSKKQKKKEKHIHSWYVYTERDKYQYRYDGEDFSYHAVAGCSCGAKLDSDDIITILNTYYHD